jgi:Protein of unknown function (DUF3500)
MIKKRIVFILLLLVATIITYAQTISIPTYTERAHIFLDSFTPDTLPIFHHPFKDSLRTRWERLPGQRTGLKLSHLTDEQKIAMHELLRSCLSTQGYLSATAVMFNEDIQQKVEPIVGRNEYWVEVFGNPLPDSLWGWKLEGHHLTLNFTFRGNKMISNTPFLMGTNPSNSITDSFRAGLVILYKEEELARVLVNSFSAEQMKKGYNPRKKTDIVYSEQDKYNIHVPNEGIYYSELNKDQQQLLKQLETEYFNNFNPGECPVPDAFFNKMTRFFYLENREKGKEHYYRIENGNEIIEYENYNNHIHVFWRTNNDFGKALIN